MNTFVSLLFIAFLLAFLANKMFRTFAAALAVFVGLWAGLNLGLNPLIAVGLAVVTYLFTGWIFYEKNIRY